jgi:O-acetylserine/cysteine efflux transporter
LPYKPGSDAALVGRRCVEQHRRSWLVEGSSPFIELPSKANIMMVASIVSQSYITTVFGYWVWNSLVKRYSAGTIAPLNLLVPVFAVLVLAPMFGEELNALQVLAAALILSGVGIFVTSQRLETLWAAMVK